MINQSEITINDASIERGRNYGIDVLRVVSAAMIVMLHVLSQGGILSASSDLTFRGESMWWIQIGCLGFVNVFALISGYVGLGSRHRLSNIINLWIQVVFYTLISKILIMLFFEKSFSIVELCKAFFPVITSENWYFTAYFALFFFIPLINELIERVERVVIKKALFFSIIIFMIMETVSSVKETGVQAGYSMLWLALMYLIGAYIKKYVPMKRLKAWQCVVGILACMTLTLISKITIEIVTLKLFEAPMYGTKFLVYTSPIMVLQAVLWVQLFSRLSIPKTLRTIVSWLSPMTFGVFVIHTETVFYRYVLRNAFSFVLEQNWLVMMGVALLATATIWLACNIIDYLRILIFKMLGIFKLTSWLGTKIENIIERILKIKFMEN